jgi:hypothetical protein
MMSRKRIVLGLAGSLAALIVALVLVLIFAFPAERVGALAAGKASAALGREIGLGGVRMRLWPVPAISLEEVTVGGSLRSLDSAAAAGPRSATPLASVARVDLRPRLGPLLRREVRLRSIRIERPVIIIEADSLAETDIPPAPEPASTDEPGFWDDSTFEIDRINIVDGSIEYRDLATGGVARIEDLDQEIRLDGDLQDGRLATLRLTGGLSAARVTIDLPGKFAVPIREMRVAIEHDAALDLLAERAQIDRFALTLQEMALEGTGEVVAWADSTARTVSLRLSTGETELTPLLASLPAAWRSWPADAAAGQEWTATAGSARLDVTIDGRMGGGESPSVDGLLDMNGVSLARGGDAVVTDFAGRLTFSEESAASDGLTGRLLGAPLDLRFSVEDFAAPVADAEITGQLDLGRAAALYLFPPGWMASGAAAVDLALAGPLRDPALLALDGAVTLAEIALSAPEWPAALDVRAGVLQFAGSELVGREISGNFGSSDLRVDFALDEWLPFAFGAPGAVLRTVFAADSRNLDLDEILPYDPDAPTYPQLFFAHLTGVPVNGQSAAAVADSLGFRRPVLPPINASGRYFTQRFTQKGVTYEDVEVQVAVADGRLDIPSGSLRFLGGELGFAARLDAPPDSAAVAPLQLQFTLNGVGAEQFLHRFTAFREHIDGALQSSGGLTMALDERLMPVVTSLGGDGTLAVIGGRIVNWSAARALGGEMGLARFDTIAFQDWGGKFQLVGSKIFLTETTMEAGDVAVRAGGSFDVAGQLDLAGTVYLSPALTAAAGGRLGALVNVAADSEGRVPVGFRLAGTTRNASASLDFSEAGARLAERARQEAEAEVRERATEAAGRILGTDIPPVASPSEAIDSARQRVESAVTDRLRGLLSPRRPAAAPPPAPPPAAPAPAAADTAGAVTDTAETTPVPPDSTAVAPDTASREG